MVSTGLLAGPGLPEEAFAFQVTNLFNQVPEWSRTKAVNIVDLERSRATIDFLQELASKQDELLVSVVKVINGIEVAQVGSEGSPAWNTVKESVNKDYDNIVFFCEAALDKITADYPLEETNEHSESD